MAAERDIVYLAALLHDIGKFWQRADPSGVKSSEEIDQLNKKFESSICPVNEGRYTHKHVIWTAQFFDTHKDIFENNSDAFGKDANSRKQIMRWSAAHHNPNPASLEECIIQFADHCSSGIDRTSSKGMEDETVEYNYEVSKGWDKFKEVRMKSVFENLLDSDKDEYRVPISEVQLTDAVFPKGKFEVNGQKEYNALWENFIEELITVPRKNIKTLSDSLLFLLEKYTVSIPSSTQHLPDVSLFEHARSTAAFALCLYDYLKEKKQFPREIRNHDEPFLLIGGDLSGIQSFIYDIVGKGAAKNLKGRSFYLQLIVDVIVQFIIDELNLNRANIVYSSGGGFYIIAPNTDFVKNRLTEILNIVATKIRKQHGTKLFLAIAYESVKKEKIFDGTLNALWKGLTEKLSALKQNRFSDFMVTEQGYKFFFEASDIGGIRRRDAVTCEEFEEKEELFPFTPDDIPSSDKPNKEYVRKSTFEQIRLGKILRNRIDYQIITHQPVKYWESEGVQSFQPIDLGYFHYFMNEDNWRKLKDRARGSIDDAVIMKVNDTQLANFDLTGNGVVNGFTFYGGNDLPRTANDEALYFDELAGDDAVSFKRLGILRMDVDRLGLIFKNGFSNEKRTFSRYSALSRSLDFFFKGYLNTIWQQDSYLRDNTLILYAGGDDLFIVGKWDASLKFAERIQDEFEKYTCKNPKMGISGGMALVGGKFPIAKAAIRSDEEEKRAKNHSFNGKDKNSISFLGMPLAWGIEFDTVKKLKNDLIKHIEESSLPKVLLGKIASLHYMKEHQSKLGQNPSWRWISAYDIGRAMERTKTQEAKDFLGKIKIDLFTNHNLPNSKYEYLDLLNFAARWAELEIRS